ncbi:hypothetical protein VPHK391_0047 [Vibrio phage K391]
MSTSFHRDILDFLQWRDAAHPSDHYNGANTYVRF